MTSIEFKSLLRAAALSLGLVGGGAFAPGASAQTAAVASSVGKPSTQTKPAPAKTTATQTTATQTKAAQPKSSPAKAAPAKTATAKSVSAKSASTKTAAAKTKKPAEPTTLDELNAAQKVSKTVADFAGWIIASGDNRELPFAVVDKSTAQILVFAADGKLKGFAPALVGSAIGDESAPGVGDRELKDIPAEDRTTPAGRYLAAFGPAAGGKKVLWIDYATSISIHALPATKEAVKEKRKQRLASKTVQDNRITHGCINVSSTFYSKVVLPAFKKSGVFYILPEVVPVTTIFPAFPEPVRIAASDDMAD